MKIVTLYLSILLFSGHLFAQDERASIIAQSPDGKTVKLMWFINDAAEDQAGIDIKRKDGLGEWVKLNATPIEADISGKKDLSAVESDPAEASRVKAVAFKLIEEHKISELPNDSFAAEWSRNEKRIQDLFAGMAHDYDLALLSGFAYVDHTVSSKTVYEYGIFKSGTDKLLAETTWNYGQIPDLNVVTQITAKGTARTKGIRVSWNADLDKMKAANVAGFNIYRQGIRLNQQPISLQNDDEVPDFSWYDKSTNGSTLSQYSISAESIFGIEGIIKSYIYNPSDHPAAYKTADMKDINSLGYYFKDGTSVKWSFPADYEKYIKGFFVEKNSFPAGYKKVSPLLDPTARTFIDKTPSPVSTYMGVRVVAIYLDKTVATSIPYVYIYFPKRQPPAPQGLKIKATREDKKTVIKFSWDPLMEGDTMTGHYVVYAEDPATGKFDSVGERIGVKKNTYSYTIAHNVASTYRFYVAAAARMSGDLTPSDTVSLEVATAELPAPVINSVYDIGGRAKIQWSYDDISDLKGFRLYQDNNLIASEQELTKDLRTFTTPELPDGTPYEFTLVAVADNNVASEPSAAVNVTIQPQKKGKRK